jgi:hypothetical protein
VGALRGFAVHCERDGRGPEALDDEVDAEGSGSPSSGALRYRGGRRGLRGQAVSGGLRAEHRDDDDAGQGDEEPEEVAPAAQQKLDTQPSPAAEEYPYLVEVVAELRKSGYDYAVEFEIGLELLLEGIEKLRPEWTTAATLAR